MASTFIEVTKDVMRLPAHQRPALVGLLLECDDLPTDSGAEPAWDTEIQSRIAHIDQGEEQGVSYEEVMRAAERKLPA